MLKQSSKQQARREHFAKLGKAISQLTPTEIAWKDRRAEHSFEIKNGDTSFHPGLPEWPQFKTPQWQRGVTRGSLLLHVLVVTAALSLFVIAMTLAGYAEYHECRLSGLSQAQCVKQLGNRAAAR